MTYIENPKVKGSGIVCCIPQVGECPNRCEDCFFASGRSYLEPLEQNLPNIPSFERAKGRIVRVNDGLDSNVKKEIVLKATKRFPMRFYNTAIPHDLEDFIQPVVLTVNPGKLTDNDFWKLRHIPLNLMFVRVRTNAWNLEKVVDPAIEYYSKREIPVVLTFMAYFTLSVKEGYEKDYVLRKRTSNIYNAITTKAWENIMNRYKYNKWVYSCGKIEGEKGITACRFCGNCIREFFVTMERLRGNNS